MAEAPEIDLVAAHNLFSAVCYNKAWELIEKTDRTPEEDEQLVRLSMASHWHWTQRKDCSPTNTSVAYWQTSRIYAILGQADNARRYARLCLDASQGDDMPPFCLGYAYEALARAEAVTGNVKEMEEYLQEARRVADTMPDPDAKKQLLDDLKAIP